VKVEGIAGDCDGDFAILLLAHQNSLPCSLNTLQGCSGWWAGFATGCQAKEKTRHEQGKAGGAGRSFEDRFHLFWFLWLSDKRCAQATFRAARETRG
jgi:hypothetical protein